MSGRFGSGNFGAGSGGFPDDDAGYGGFAQPGRSRHLGDALSALLDGELAPPQADAARAHVVSCPECAGELEAVSQARTWVRALPPVEPPFGFYDRMLAARGPITVAAPVLLSPPVPLRAALSLRRRAALAAFGAAAAAVTVLSVGSPQQSPVVPSVPHLVGAHATSASVNADLVSKVAPMAVPGSFRR
jgi:anti-sigma factor RsiW